MPSSADLERALAAAGVVAPVRWDEVTGSTNEIANAMAVEGAPEWTLVATGHQTAGRGRVSRQWRDVPGGSLLFSLVLRPRLEPSRAGLLSLLGGAAMAEAASELAERAVRCEWPNDLISDEAKVGGILGASSVLGGRMSHVILGLGVNLVAPPEVPGSGGIGEELDDMELLTCFLANFKNGYLPEDPGFAEHVGDRWRSVNITLGREVSATALDGSVVSGTAVDLDERGGLLIKTERGVVTVAFGDVARLD